jgi:endonuclease YncB( thermonuclease family)
MRMTSVLLFFLLTTHAAAHSGGLNKQGCHAGSQPYHCHKAQEAAPSASSGQTVLTGKVTHVRDGDTIEVDRTPIRLAALDCPERGIKGGNYATKLAEQFQGLQATCELTGAKTYDRLVGYCSINGADFGAIHDAKLCLQGLGEIRRVG